MAKKTKTENKAKEFKSFDPAVHAAHGEVTGKPTMDTLRMKIGKAIAGDERFDDGRRGMQPNNSYAYEPYCCDILVPDDDGQMEAVVRCSDGKLYRVGFTWDGENVKLADGDPTETETTTVYAKAIAEHEQIVKAAQGKSTNADRNEASEAADAASSVAHSTGKKDDHEKAMGKHKKAAGMYEAHHDESNNADSRRMISYHTGMADKHEKKMDADGDDDSSKASEVKSKDIIHCRNSGVVLAEATPKKWMQDVPVEFQWMPGGVTTIEASWNSRPIRLTVECDEEAATSVQASFEDWKEKYPKQEPFGCIEHREEEAAIRPDSFSWKDDPEPGVYCTARPTELGAKNVNGKIHRSWSPSFRTDACYAESKCGSCRKGIQACKCGDDAFVTFPDGVRGSKSNPARITGVDFSVGSLTNKPAFKNILPVRAKQANTPQPETPNAENKPKGIKVKVKFIKARGANAAGSYGELEDTEAIKAISSGEAMQEDAAKAIEASEARSKAYEDAQKKSNEEKVVQAVARAVKRGAVVPKGDGVNSETTVKAKHLGFLTKGSDVDLIVDLLDHLPAVQDMDKLTNRFAASVQDNGHTVQANARFEHGAETPGQVCDYVIKAREPMNGIIRNGSADSIKAASQIARETCALLKAHVVPGFEKGDFALKDVIHATNSDTTDPNSQVGTLSSTMILMRNLGFLKNKLGFLPYISTDLRNEPASFGQPVQTRYITPPAVLTYIPGTGYTSDVTSINNYIASRGTNKAGVGPAATALAANSTGTLTPSAPGTTDVNVVINNHLATEIVFPTSTLGGTVRNLFAEQQGAQMYSLSEIVNQVFLATMFSATWSGLSAAALPLGGNAFGLPGVIKIKTKFTANKMPDTGRFALLHSFYHDNILTDANLLSAKAILALIKKDAGSFEDGELPVLFGVRVLESQLAAFDATLGATVAASMLGLVTPTDPATIGAVAKTAVGFAGNSASALFVARIPNDYTTVFKDVPATAAMEIVTEPDSGLSLLFTKYVNHQLASVSARASLMFGIAQGDPRQGFLLAP